MQKGLEMLEMQVAFLKSMTDIATSFADACAVGPSKGDSTNDSSDALASGSDSDIGCASSLSPSWLPELPESGRSWYREPFENPFLAFWDESLKPWRTFSAVPAFSDFSYGPAAYAWSYGAMGLAPHAIGKGMEFSQPCSALVNFWTSPWRAAAEGSESAGMPKSEKQTAAPSEVQQIGESLQSFVAFHSENGMAMARTFFPDHTTVKFELPLPNLTFAAPQSKAFRNPY
jgi:hypothetical protein